MPTIKQIREGLNIISGYIDNDSIELNIDESQMYASDCAEISKEDKI